MRLCVCCDTILLFDLLYMRRRKCKRVFFIKCNWCLYYILLFFFCFFFLLFNDFISIRNILCILISIIDNMITILMRESCIDHIITVIYFIDYLVIIILKQYNFIIVLLLQLINAIR